MGSLYIPRYGLPISHHTRLCSHVSPVLQSRRQEISRLCRTQCRIPLRGLRTPLSEGHLSGCPSSGIGNIYKEYILYICIDIYIYIVHHYIYIYMFISIGIIIFIIYVRECHFYILWYVYVYVNFYIYTYVCVCRWFHSICGLHILHTHIHIHVKIKWTTYINIHIYIYIVVCCGAWWGGFVLGWSVIAKDKNHWPPRCDLHSCP